MNRLIILSVFLIANSLAQGDELSLELRPPRPSEIIRVPSNMIYQLILTTPAIKDRTEKPPGPITLDPEHAIWGHVGNYRVTKPGPATLGPFSLRWHEKILTSKPTHFIALSEWDGVYTTILRAKHEEIDLGDTLYIYLESWSEVPKEQKPDLQRSEAYEIVSKTHRGSSGTTRSRPVNYQAVIFEIRPNHEGPLHITADDIEHLEKDLNLTPLVIDVKGRP